MGSSKVGSNQSIKPTQPTEPITNQRELVDFLLNEVLFPPEFRVCKHAHTMPMFCVSIAGGCTELYVKKTRLYEPLAFEYLPANHEHSLVMHQQGMRAFGFEFPSELLVDLIFEPLHRICSWRCLPIDRCRRTEIPLPEHGFNFCNMLPDRISAGYIRRVVCGNLDCSTVRKQSEVMRRLHLIEDYGFIDGRSAPI